MDVARAARLQALLQHPSWPELIAVVEEQCTNYEAFALKLAMTTGNLPDGFDYKRGFLAGMRHITRYPGAAEKAFKREAVKEKNE